MFRQTDRYLLRGNLQRFRTTAAYCSYPLRVNGNRQDSELVADSLQFAGSGADPVFEVASGVNYSNWPCVACPGQTGKYLTDVTSVVQNNTGAYTFAAWVQSDLAGSTPAVDQVVWKTASNFNYLVIRTTGVVNIKVNGGAGVGVTTFSAAWDWTARVGRHHIAYTYDHAATTSNVRLFLNGAFVAAQTVANTTVQYSGNQIYVGGPLASAAEQWQGRMSDVAWYSGVLTDSEIATIGTPKFGRPILAA